MEILSTEELSRMVGLSVASDLERFGPEVRAPIIPSVHEAAEYCRRLTTHHYENFTVASKLLPRDLLPHFHAVYAYCRWADDLADEAASPRQSLVLLDWWESQLDRCYAGEAEHPVFVALRNTIAEFSIPREPFANLLIAFRQDQQTRRYARHQEVLEYCRNSANPVGHLVLYLGRVHDAQRVELADAVCTGLQLINFCQDVARDWKLGRLYLPTETLERCGCDDTMLSRAVATRELCQAVEIEVARAESYLHRGEPLVELMPDDLRLDIALFIAGGLAIAREIRRVRFDVWRERPTLSKFAKLRLLAGCWWRMRQIAGRTTGKETP